VFERIRVQILYPCQARCAWCATHRKNPLFAQLYRDGVAEVVHRFYVDAIRRLRPREVFVSGGEPLLCPDLPWFLNAIQDSTERIHLFTSYQFSQRARGRVPFSEMPLAKITLNHTLIYFEPAHWDKLTQGFPWDLYVENLRAAMRVPARKRFKFIVNHDRFDREIARFQEMVGPDRRCELGLKAINDQGGGLNASAIHTTSVLVRQRAMSLDKLVAGVGWGAVNWRAGSFHAMSPLLETGEVERCVYRREPIELRFALYRADRERQILKYRYCPYFPSSFGPRFHIGRDDPHKLERNYRKGSFREHCPDCRFLEYLLSE
jgi:hypothetical protein